MKKILPIFKDTSGFTLVELMVVIAIIGILAVVALGIFSGAQGSARDSRRVAEIDSLSKNIESTREPQTGNYLYTGGALGGTSFMARDYPTGLADPGTYVYCQLAATTNANLPANPATPWTTACPAGWAQIGATGGTTPNAAVAQTPGPNNDVADGNTGGTATRAWRVCASLERSNTLFCKTNIVQ